VREVLPARRQESRVGSPQQLEHGLAGVRAEEAGAAVERELGGAPLEVGRVVLREAPGARALDEELDGVGPFENAAFSRAPVGVPDP